MPRSNFQTQCLQRCNDLLGKIPGLEHSGFQEVVGRKETYLKAMVKGSQRVLEVYIYENEAGYMMVGGEWVIFEKQDYSSADELLQAFLAGLLEKLR